MTTIKRQIKINKPVNEVWKALADFGNICHGHPSVKKSYVTSEQKEGIGATRHCDFTMMNAAAEERIIEWNEGKNIKIEVYELKNMPGMDSSKFDLQVETLDNNSSILTGTMMYNMKNAFFDLINSVAMKRANATVVSGIMAGHKKYIETGEIINNKTPLELDKVIKLG